MQFVNDDNDDLFRRAGTEYPLNTHNADWDKLKAALDAMPASGGSPKKRPVGLLVLLALAFISGLLVMKMYYDTPSTQISSTAPPANHQTTPDTPANTAGTGNRPLTEAPLPRQGTGHVQSASGSTSNPQGTTTQSALLNSKRPAGKPTGANTQKLYTTNKPQSTGLPTGNDRHQPAAILPGEPIAKKAVVTHLGRGAIHPKNKKTMQPAGKSTTTTGLQQHMAGNTPTGQLQSMNTPAMQPVTKHESTEAPALAGQQNTEAAPGPTAAPEKQIMSLNGQSPHGHLVLPVESTKGIDTTSATAGNTRSSKQKNKPAMYLMLVAAPDFSKVSNARFTKPGSSAGLVAGVQVVKNLYVETGFLWSSKNYNSPGSAFDSGRLALPPHSKVLRASGSCNMYEVPINLKFSVPGKKFDWFVAGGLSSYIMQREDYGIQYTRYNQPYYHKYYYNNSGSNWLAIFNVSIGTRAQVGKHYLLEAAPYFKLPLSGVGAANLPIKSIGLQVALGSRL